jgi:hypothetical protein
VSDGGFERRVCVKLNDIPVDDERIQQSIHEACGTESWTSTNEDINDTGIEWSEYVRTIWKKNGEGV